MRSIACPSKCILSNSEQNNSQFGQDKEKTEKEKEKENLFLNFIILANLGFLFFHPTSRIKNKIRDNKFCIRTHKTKKTIFFFDFI